jgi:hypothetical protein
MLGVAFAAAFFLGGVANATGWVSPVGTWDFTVSGAKLGTVYLTFNDDIHGKTISGYINVIPGFTPKQTATGETVTFGFATLTGLWEFNQNGQVVGFLNNPPTDTVRLDIESFTGGVSSNENVFTMTGQTLNGPLTLNGVQMQVQTPLPDVWTIQKIMQGDVTFTEVFFAQQDPDLGGYNNLYDFAGWGADICIFGVGTLSKGNNFGITITEYPMPDSGGCESITPSFAQAGTKQTGRKAALAVSGKVGLGPPGPPPSTGIVSSAIGKINLHTGVANLAGYETGDPAAKVTMPVFCQEE